VLSSGFDAWDTREGGIRPGGPRAIDHSLRARVAQPVSLPAARVTGFAGSARCCSCVIRRGGSAPLAIRGGPPMLQEDPPAQPQGS